MQDKKIAEAIKIKQKTMEINPNDLLKIPNDFDDLASKKLLLTDHDINILMAEIDSGRDSPDDSKKIITGGNTEILTQDEINQLLAAINSDKAIEISSGTLSEAEINALLGKKP